VESRLSGKNRKKENDRRRRKKEKKEKKQIKNIYLASPHRCHVFWGFPSSFCK